MLLLSLPLWRAERRSLVCVPRAMRRRTFDFLNCQSFLPGMFGNLVATSGDRFAPGMNARMVCGAPCAGGFLASNPERRL